MRIVHRPPSLAFTHELRRASPMRSLSRASARQARFGSLSRATAGKPSPWTRDVGVAAIEKFRRGAVVSRILFPPRRRLAAPLRRLTTIPLGPALLAGSSNLPGGFGRAVLKRLPIWSCSVRGFACHLPYSRRGALLPHLFTLTPIGPTDVQARRPDFPGALENGSGAVCSSPRHSAGRQSDQPERYIFCATVLRVAPTGNYPAHCPVEFGLSSRLRAFSASAGKPARSTGARRPTVV